MRKLVFDRALLPGGWAQDVALDLKDGAILANTGHFNVEIEIPALRSMAGESREVRAFVEEFELSDGRKLFPFGGGGGGGCSNSCTNSCSAACASGCGAGGRASRA